MTCWFHDYEYYWNDRSTCNQTGICKKCGARNSRVSHEGWGTWREKAPNSCEKFKICIRCGQREFGEIYERHQWDDPVYVSSNDCTIIRHCGNCGKVDTVMVGAAIGDALGQAVFKNSNPNNGPKAHQWGEWQYNANSGQSVRVCRRCGTREYR